MKKILITGSNSYIGKSVIKWLSLYPSDYYVEEISVRDSKWLDYDFSKFDVILHVAGLAHDSKSKKNADLYYKVNRDLALEVAQKAKDCGVKQFIFISSILIYNGCKEKVITKNTIPKSKGVYSDSKFQADMMLQKLDDVDFKVAIIRAPMIFGPNCKGNFPKLKKLASIIPIFPKINNQRSMLFIDNLCEFIRLLIDSNSSGIFFPPNENYYSTIEIIKIITSNRNRKIYTTKLLNIFVYVFKYILKPLDKMFGNLIYEKSISNHFNNNYVVVDNYNSILLSIKD